MGFIEDLTTYVWNWCVWKHVQMAGEMCWMAGGWGLAFDDDDGTMMKNCFDLWGGVNVDFPVKFSSSYAEE